MVPSDISFSILIFQVLSTGGNSLNCFYNPLIGPTQLAGKHWLKPIASFCKRETKPQISLI